MTKRDIDDQTRGATLLKLLMEQNNWSVEELAEKIGDAPLRIYKVLNGEEILGRTALLAAMAIQHRLAPIEKP